MKLTLLNSGNQTKESIVRICKDTLRELKGVGSWIPKDSEITINDVYVDTEHHEYACIRTIYIDYSFKNEYNRELRKIADTPFETLFYYKDSLSINEVFNILTDISQKLIIELKDKTIYSPEYIEKLDEIIVYYNEKTNLYTDNSVDTDDSVDDEEFLLVDYMFSIIDASLRDMVDSNDYKRRCTEKKILDIKLKELREIIKEMVYNKGK